MQIIKYMKVFQLAVCHVCSKISADVIYLFNQKQILSNIGAKLQRMHMLFLFSLLSNAAFTGELQKAVPAEVWTNLLLSSALLCQDAYILRVIPK